MTSNLRPPVRPPAFGEQYVARLTAAQARGSSPRMRGTAVGHRANFMGQRFIPAHAGNRFARRPSPLPLSVHPRACGEQLLRPLLGQTTRGSSPRMRGTGFGAGLAAGSYRFIPAHAGNSRLRVANSSCSAVHPRACGEQTSRDSRNGYANGSSPRMRGTVRSAGRATRECRFIPAHAGNSGAVKAHDTQSPVHPRACGEQASHLEPSPASAGSSPRMRGTAL